MSQTFSADWVSQTTRLLTRIQSSPYIPEKPFHGVDSPLNHPRQAAFVVAPEKEVLYGGAAGGGKSSALLMAALMYVDQPGYHALIVRKNFPQLEQTLIARAHEWLDDTDARWSEQKKIWRFPSGAVLRFGHLGDPKARFNYQGAEYQYIGFDELTQFERRDYEYLFSRLRRLEGSPVPIRMRAGSNPGGIGHEWVKQKFHVEQKPGERRYIPATLDDNPFLDRAEYEKALAELDPVTFEQLRHGRWDVVPTGGWFRDENFVVEDQDQLPHMVRRVRFWDFAATAAHTGGDPDWTVGCLVGIDRDGFYHVLDVRRFREEPAATEKIVAQVAAIDGKGVEIAAEQEPGSSGKTVADHYRRKVLQGYAFWAERSTGSKIERARPAVSAVAGGLVRIVRAEWNRVFLEELRVFPQPGWHDDQVDAFSAAMQRLGAGSGAAFSDAWEQMAEPEEEVLAVEVVQQQTSDAAEQNRLLRRLQ